MGVSEKQAQLLEDLSHIEDRHERLAAVVDRVRNRPPLPSDLKSDHHRVPGCISAVWLVAELQAGRLRLRFDAESPVVKGLVALLVDLYDNATPADVIATEPTLIRDLGLARDLSPTRLNGLSAVRARIKSLAQSACMP